MGGTDIVYLIERYRNHFTSIVRGTYGRSHQKGTSKGREKGDGKKPGAGITSNKKGHPHFCRQAYDKKKEKRKQVGPQNNLLNLERLNPLGGGGGVGARGLPQKRKARIS